MHREVRTGGTVLILEFPELPGARMAIEYGFYGRMGRGKIDCHIYMWCQNRFTERSPTWETVPGETTITSLEDGNEEPVYDPTQDVLIGNIVHFATEAGRYTLSIWLEKMPGEQDDVPQMVLLKWVLDSYMFDDL